MKKFLSIILSVILMLSIIPLTVYADDSDNVYCQYTGSTTASWGYKPNCTFTVNKIVGDKFKGSFVATNLGSYNLSKQVEGTVYKDIYCICQKGCRDYRMLCVRKNYDN